MVGGNLIVGLVVFLILIVIQFVVVTTGAGTGGRGGRPVHPRRHAREADGHRRRPQLRAHQPAGGQAPAPGDVGRSRLLRGHGRGGQVRPGRRHRRHRHHRHQPDRRSDHRHRPAPSLGLRRHPHLQPPERGRRARLADPRPSDVHLDRPHRHPGRHRRRGLRHRPHRPGAPPAPGHPDRRRRHDRHGHRAGPAPPRLPGRGRPPLVHGDPAGAGRSAPRTPSWPTTPTPWSTPPTALRPWPPTCGWRRSSSSCR